jgi:serine/threonine-protein kinase
VSAELDAVVRHCLQKAPARRFPTMTAVREALEESSSTRAASQQLSIAVLPFESLSTDPDSEHFGDGLAEEIINLLVQSPGLRVIARTSSWAFKGKREDVRRIAKTLDVAHVLDGSVRKVSHRIRVTARLISARDGSHIWSDRYDRELADVFAVQDEIAQAIAFTLHRSLGGQLAPHRRPTRSLAAYEAFLRSRHYLLDKLDFARSLACLEEAVTLDPEFALAHAFLGVHFLSVFTGQAMAAHDAVPLARRHVHRALELDPSQSEAHAVLGCIAAMYDFDWEEADRRFHLALTPRKSLLDVRTLRANFFLAHAGRGREAVEDMEQAAREDPLHWGSSWALAVAYRSVGRDVDADRLFAHVMGDTGRWSAVPAVVLSGNHLARGQMQEALAFAETAYAKNASLPSAVGQLAGVLARAGDDGRATSLVDRLRPGTTFGAPFGLALYYLAIDDRDQCADWLEKAIEQRDVWVSFLLNVGNIGGRAIWSSPQWPRLARLMNVSVPRGLP